MLFGVVAAAAAAVVVVVVEANWLGTAAAPAVDAVVAAGLPPCAWGRDEGRPAIPRCLPTRLGVAKKRRVRSILPGVDAHKLPRTSNMIRRAE